MPRLATVRPRAALAAPALLAVPPEAPEEGGFDPSAWRCLAQVIRQVRKNTIQTHVRTAIATMVLIAST